MAFGVAGLALGLVTMLLPPIAILSGPCGIAAIVCAFAGWRSAAPSSGGEWRSSAAVALGLVTLAMVGVGLWGVYAIAS